MRTAKRLRGLKKRNAQKAPRTAFREKGMWIIATLFLPILTSVISQCILLWLQHWLKW